MNRLAGVRAAVLIFPLAVVGICNSMSSSSALVVNDGPLGADETSANTYLSVTALPAAGYTVTTHAGVPAGSLAGYNQIWDIRYNNTVLSASDITAYLTYLSGGGSLFLMGENTGFITRDNSIASFVVSAGGGTITPIVSALNAEIAQAPFTGPSPLTTLTILAAAGSASRGTGSFIIKDGNNIGAGIVWPPGTLSNAPLGTLMVLFDVNFMETGADANNHALLNNMINYLTSPVPIAPPPVTSVPTLSEGVMVLLAGGLIAITALRLRAWAARSGRAQPV